MSKHHIAGIALFGLLCVTAPALAHHAFAAEYDNRQLVIVSGILTKVEWENPHGWLYVDVKDEKGNVANWAFETVSPNPIHHMYPNARTDLLSNVGKTVTIAACPAKTDPYKASAMGIKLANGTIMKVGLPGTYKGAQNIDEVLQGQK